MNILELCLSSGLGGLELYVYNAAESLRNKHKVTVVLNETGKLTSHFKQCSATQVLTLKSGFKPLPLINAYKLAKMIDTLNIDIIHMHWGNDLALAAFAKQFSSCKPKLIYTRHMKITRDKSDLYHSFIYGKMDLMLTITEKLEQEAKHFISRYKSRIKILYHGVKKPDELLTQEQISASRNKIGLQDNNFVIGLFGRLEKGKGQHLLIQSIALAKQHDITLYALIVGHEMNPGYLDKMQTLARSLGLEKQIRFHGFTATPQQLMQICDCISLTSGEETFGLVLPEAMRAGICVIGSNKGGVLEIIEHEKTGLLFKSGDASSLYTQIARLYSDKSFKTELAENGKTKADNIFNLDTHFSTLEGIFKHLIFKNL
ncbi:MAG: glycosyltransferase family 4 protein [Gammaproteobacteria bacterium]|nr:glycosyltransferase family 4 protein [Gammaproteobacteria bacterium]